MKKLMILAGLVIASGAAAQIRLEKAVISDAGSTVSNGSTRMQFTTGQTAAARASNGTTVGMFGFWNRGKATQSVRAQSVGNIRSVSVSPNPASREITIDVSLTKGEQMDLLVFDESGRLVSTLYSVSAESGNFRKKFTCAHLSNGAYYLAVRTPGSLLETRFAIVR